MTTKTETTVYDVRRDNLRTLANQWGGNTQLALRLGYSSGSFISQIIGPHPTRKITEEKARDMEAKLELPPRWLDLPHSHSQDTLTAECVRVVTEVANAHVSPEKQAELVILALDDARYRGRCDELFVRRLVKLAMGN